jgi:MbtH protein
MSEIETAYKVVVSDEGRYSIWPNDRNDPPGWKNAGHTGSKAKCLEYINRPWTDMRPLSLRQRMDKPA